MSLHIAGSLWVLSYTPFPAPASTPLPTAIAAIETWSSAHYGVVMSGTRLLAHAACLLESEHSSMPVITALASHATRYENSGSGASFTQHDLSTSTYHPYWVQLIDVDSDGDAGAVGVGTDAVAHFASGNYGSRNDCWSGSSKRHIVVLLPSPQTFSSATRTVQSSGSKTDIARQRRSRPEY